MVNGTMYNSLNPSDVTETGAIMAYHTLRYVDQRLSNANETSEQYEHYLMQKDAEYGEAMAHSSVAPFMAILKAVNPLSPDKVAAVLGASREIGLTNVVGDVLSNYINWPLHLLATNSWVNNMVQSDQRRLEQHVVDSKGEDVGVKIISPFVEDRNGVEHYNPQLWQYIEKYTYPKPLAHDMHLF